MGMPEKIRVLVVDDDEQIVEMVKILLAQAGCDTQIAYNAKKGMELAMAQQFDLIVLDINLPDGNGIELCRELKQRHLSYRTPIIFMSGRHHEEDILRGQAVGAVDYILKPFKVDDFIQRILVHTRAT